MGAFDFVGDLFNRSARDRAARANYDSRDTYKDLNGDITAQEVDGNAFDGLDGAPRTAQMRALDQLANIGSAGGMDDGSRAALQQAQFRNAQQAKSQTDAALQRAAAEGRSNSGRALSAQMQSQQGAANADAMAGSQAVGDARMRAMNAMAMSGQLGGAVRGQDQAGAAAQNQINAFNAQQRQGAQNQSFNNNLGRARGIESANQTIAGTNNNRAQQARDSAGSIGDAVVSGVTAAATGGLSSLGSAAGGIGSAAQGAAQNTMQSQVSNGIHNVWSKGGVIPGEPSVQGDSEANDTVPAKLSPGEVVVPRTVVQGGPDAVRDFVARLLKDI